MIIDETSWKVYIAKLRKVNDTAAEFVRQYLETNGIPTDRDEINALIEYANAVCMKYSEASATLAAEMYDALATLSGKTLPPALPAAAPEMSEVAKAIVGTINLDYRSLYHHFECATYMYKTGCIADIEKDFQKTLAAGREVTGESIKKEKFSYKVIGQLAKMISPLM